MQNIPNPNLSDRFTRRRAIYFLLILAALMGASLMVPTKANAAISNLFPQAGNHSPSGSVLAVSSRSGSWGDCLTGVNASYCQTGLDSGDVFFKVFRAGDGDPSIPGPDGSSSDRVIWLNGACAPFPSDVNAAYGPYGGNKGNNQILVEVKQTKADGRYDYPNLVGIRQNGSGSSDCVGNDMRVVIPGSAFTLNQQDRFGTTYRTALVRVLKYNVPGTMHYRVWAPAADLFVTFDDLGYHGGGGGASSYGSSYPGFSAFALHEADPGGPAETSFEFKFKPDCRHGQPDAISRDIWLKWTDADSDPSLANDDRDIAWSLDGPGPGKPVNRSGRQLGGQGWNARSQWSIGTLIPEQTYTWRWSNVDKTNGVQFWMPFSEGTTLIDCPVAEPPASACDLVEFRLPNKSSPSDPDNYRYALWVNDGGSYVPPSGTYSAGSRYPGGDPGGSPDYLSTTDFSSGVVAEGRTVNTNILTGVVNITGGGAGAVTRNTGKGDKLVSGVMQWMVVAYNRRSGGQFEVARVYEGSPGLCYRASCEVVDIVENVPGSSGVDDARIAGTSSSALVRLRNIGVNTLPSTLSTTAGSFGLSGTSIVPNTWGAPPGSFFLPAWSSYFSPHGAVSIPSGGERFVVVDDLTLPNTIENHTLSVYPDYWGRGGIGDACQRTIPTYQPFRFNPVVDSVNIFPDPEDPLQIQYNTHMDRVSGNNNEAGFPVAYNTSSPISTSVTNRLIYMNSVPAPISPDGPDLHNQGYPPPPPSGYVAGRSFGPGDGLVFDDTVAGRGFVHGGEADTWKVGDQVCGEIGLSLGSGWLGPSNVLNPQAANSPNSCETIEDRPYVRVYGADVFAGGKFGLAGSGSGLARILGYTKSGTYGAGSGAEFAAFAFDDIMGFTTASLRTAAPTSPFGLSFATPTSGANWGGDFSDRRAIIDYYNTTRKPEPEVTLKDSSSINLADDAQTPRGLQTWIRNPGYDAGNRNVDLINPGGVYSKRHSLYVKGDLVIKNNIAYQVPAGGWGSVAAIPSNWIIVEGNIYIDRTVSRLDGLFVAQPLADGSKGRIYTCTDGAQLLNSGNLYSSCTTPLKVNGAFVSQETRLLRTGNTISSVPMLSPPSGGLAPINLVWSNNGPTGGVCKQINEPSDPDSWGDNYLCAASNYGLNWYHGGPSGGPAPGEECTRWDHPGQPAGHTWGDNYLCAPAGSNLQLEFSTTGQIGTKDCIQIREPSDDRWGNNVYLCYRKGIAGSEAVYEREPFATTRAAESFRLGPEFYLAQPVTRTEGSQSNGEFDYVISLPPLL